MQQPHDTSISLRFGLMTGLFSLGPMLIVTAGISKLVPFEELSTLRLVQLFAGCASMIGGLVLLFMGLTRPILKATNDHSEGDDPSNRLDKQLRQLAGLKNDGLLSDSEHEEIRRRILKGISP